VCETERFYPSPTCSLSELCGTLSGVAVRSRRVHAPRRFVANVRQAAAASNPRDTGTRLELLRCLTVNSFHNSPK
jgi:hypothetical protein